MPVMVAKKFVCKVFAEETWNAFAAGWASVAYDLLLREVGAFDHEPNPVIVRAPEQNYETSGFTGMYLEGQIYLHPSLQSDRGKLLRLITHELLHASLSSFPAEDIFYAEGFVDYATMVLATRPDWGPVREQMQDATQQWASFRQAQALKCRCDTDAKRWMGFVFASSAYGVEICSSLKAAKQLSPRSWWLPRSPTERQNCIGPYRTCPI
jgi:hypothetical protein